MGTKAQRKPDMNYININTICDDIDKCVIEFFTMRNVDIYDIQQCKSIPHNIVSLCMKYIYNKCFKPNTNLWNNQKSLIDYDNCDLLQVIANKFIDICLNFNKSLGLMSFSYMTGIDITTLLRWGNDEKSNPARCQIINNIKDCHKAAQISLLNDSPVGALAVANNDTETGLEWSTKQAITAANNAVFLIPSERLQRLSIQDTKSIVQNAE